MIVSCVCLAAAILLGIGGQIALKSTADGSVSMIAQVVNPLTIIGFAIYVLAALCYIVALKKIPVSIAFPSVSASYALVRSCTSAVERAPWPTADCRPCADR
jgi:multidrug transporter EmrE-like cation transporter